MAGGGLKRQNFQKIFLHTVISYITTVISTCSFVSHDYVPPLFRAILNFLRSGHLEEDCDENGLLDEATFFGLSGLQEALQNRKKSIQSKLKHNPVKLVQKVPSSTILISRD